MRRAGVSATEVMRDVRSRAALHEPCCTGSRRVGLSRSTPYLYRL
jgi:hypothetical protein